MHRGAGPDARTCRRSADALFTPADQHECACEANILKVLHKITEIIEISDEDFTQQRARQMVSQIFQGPKSPSLCGKHWPKTVRVLSIIANELSDWLPPMEEYHHPGGR